LAQIGFWLRGAISSKNSLSCGSFCSGAASFFRFLDVLPAAASSMGTVLAPVALLALARLFADVPSVYFDQARARWSPWGPYWYANCECEINGAMRTDEKAHYGKEEGVQAGI
jgi:hypothetical protein